MKYVLPVSAVLLLAACAGPMPKPDAVLPAPAKTAPLPAPTANPVSMPAPAPVVAAAANDDLNAVAWTQNAVEHDLIFREIYRNAQEKLLKALHDKRWDALPHDERTGPVAALKPAVILDIDETVLDNSPYQARLVRNGKAYSDATWAAWVREEKARALPGALSFTKFAASHGITVFYISNRAQDLDRATLDNLHKLGFPVQGDNAFLGLGTHVKGCQQKGTQKTCRRKLVGRNYRVLMQFGDQIGDFVSVSDNTLQARRGAVAPYRDWFGQRWFVLPNPTYGSWEPALFGNDWSQPESARRKAKIDSLRFDDSSSKQ